MGTFWRALRLIAAVQLGFQYAHVQAQLNLDLRDVGSIKNTSAQLAASAMKYYDGNKPGGTPGMFSAIGEFNWWEAGALFGQMVEYWYYTGDNTYNDITKQALLFQAGPDHNYEPENQTRTEGNDDQAFWAFAAMSAAEMKFPNPDPKQPQWLALAQAVFNRQAGRWDAKHCNGGLRWQFNPLNNGFMEKNTISNGCFFQLAARLARYTKNETYADWANKAYDWMVQSPLIHNNTYEVFDSFGFTEQKCNDQPGLVQWSYNIGTIIAGTAFMYNHTNGAAKWRDRLNGYLNNTQKVFFPSDYGGKIMVEYACEGQGNCNKDQRSFKAYLSRWLAVAAQLAPYTQDQIMPWLQTSAGAAVKVCSGGPPDGIVCGRKWYVNKDDGTRDIGNQMTALGIVQANLIKNVPALADMKTGTSTGDASAGNGNKQPTKDDILATRPITTGDKAGAWLVTVVMILVTIAWVTFLLSDRDNWDWLHSAYDGSNSHQWYGR